MSHNDQLPTAQEDPHASIQKLDSIFPYGRLLVTSTVAVKQDEDEGFLAFVLKSLKRHLLGDWGDVNEKDAQANNASLKQGLRLVSAYQSETYPEIWIITERDRSITTVLFPNEY